MGKIFIRDLKLSCIIGCSPEERNSRQEIIVNLEMQCDLRTAGRSDNLNDTVDYFAIKESIIQLAEESRFHLIESLAEQMADIALADDKVKKVVVTIDKPGALQLAKSSAVEIIRP